MMSDQSKITKAIFFNQWKRLGRRENTARLLTKRLKIGIITSQYITGLSLLIKNDDRFA